MVVYAYDDRDPRKQRLAQAAIAGELDRLPTISTQVLQEFYVAVTGAVTGVMATDAAMEAVRLLSDWRVVRPDAQTVLEAAVTSEAAQISFWDALIIRTAVAGGCHRILTEDLNAGQTIDGVLIENPFAA